MKLLLLTISILMMTAAATAQDVTPRPVEPVKVNFAVQGETSHADELRRVLRSELQKRRDVVVTARKPDYAVDVVVAPVTVDGDVVAYAAALLITRKSGGDFLAVVIEPDLQTLARQVAVRFNQSTAALQHSRRRENQEE